MLSQQDTNNNLDSVQALVGCGGGCRLPAMSCERDDGDVASGSKVKGWVNGQVNGQDAAGPSESTAGDGGEWTTLQPSPYAVNTVNPLRRIVDVTSVDPHPDKKLLKMHIGDPTITGCLPTHPNVLKAVADTLQAGRYNGYGPAIGYPEIRQQLSEFLNQQTDDQPPIGADDIVLTSGCSHALQLAIEVLGSPGKNMLTPRPGFPLYTTLMRPLGVENRYYNLLKDCDWEADLPQMESLIDSQTAAIIVNNPNNPTGAVYSKRHLEQILRLAEKYRVPIIADEIYGNMTYGGRKFYPMRTLKPAVPLLTCDGISKRYLVPGWRLGWLVLRDVDGCLARVRTAVRQLAQKIVGPCALMQGSLPDILRNTPDEFFEHNNRLLAENVDVVCRLLADVPGVRPVRSHGALYIMVVLEPEAFPAFRNDEMSMAQRLIAEESVYCLPGSAFSYPGALRMVVTHSPEIMTEMCHRFRDFCQRYYHQVKGQQQPRDAPAQ